jgi:hypothetical protein
MERRVAWKIVAVGTGLAAGAVARASLDLAWKRIGDSEPPTGTLPPRTSWPRALTWSITVGVAMAVTRLVAQRGAAEAWHAATGSYPEPAQDES